MKHILAIIIVLLLILSPICSVSYAETKYVDNDTGVSFTVPDGWKQRPLSNEYDTLKVQFATEDGAMFQFGFMDYYGVLSDEYKKMFKRADITSDFLTPYIMSEIAGLPESDIKTEKHSNYDFYYFFVSTRKTFMRMHNGYIFVFSYFTLDPDSSTSAKRKNECEAILDSVVFPSTQNTKASSSITAKPSVTTRPVSSVTSQGTSSSQFLKNFGYRIFIIFLAGLVLAVGRYVIRKVKGNSKSKQRIIADAQHNPIGDNKETNEFQSSTNASQHQYTDQNASAYTYQTMEKESNDDSPRISTDTIKASNSEPSKTDVLQYCRKCGKRLLPDSVFCDRCGTKIQ